MQLTKPKATVCKIVELKTRIKVFNGIEYIVLKKKPSKIVSKRR